MLKYALLITLISLSAPLVHSHLAHCDDANDETPDQGSARRNIYQKLGITNGDSNTESAPEAAEAEREPAQEQPQQREDNAAHDNPDQPAN
jgi:hypothetical protein